MKTWKLAVSLATLTILLALPSRLLASCGQAFCPIEVSTVNERPLLGQQLSLNFTYEFIDQDQPYVGASSARVGQLPRDHDEQFTRNNTYKLSLDYGITSRFTVGVLLPFLDRLHQHIGHEQKTTDLVGADLAGYENPQRSISGTVNKTERWRYQEFGDMQVTTRYLLVQPENPLRPALSLILGAKLPTGRTGVSNGEEKAELSLQPGNGSWDGIVGLAFVQSFSVSTLQRQTALAPVFMTALGRFPAGVGKFGYTPGGELFLNVGIAYPIFRKLDVLAQVNFHYRDRDSVGHAPGVDQSDTGREELFFSPGLRYHLTDALDLYAHVQVAAYRRVNGIQLTSDWNLTSGVSYRFNLFSGA
jgi:hypothetical protein